MRRTWPISAASVLVLSLAAPFAGQAFGAESPPNILLIVVDDLGWTGLQCYGSDLHQTPHIDRLAAEGLRFTQAYAAAPVCSPTRASIQSGKSPARLHMTIWYESSGVPKETTRAMLPPVTEGNLRLSETTLAEALRTRGYRTAHIGKWHLGDAAHYPENHGFDLNIGGTFWGCPATYFYPFRGPFGRGREMRYVPGLGFGNPGDYLTDRLTEAALSVIDQADGAPFFINLCYYTVHTPIEGKPELVDKYRRRIKPGMDHDNPNYAAMHQTLDENVGRLLAKLRERGLEENTVVLLTSDNGGYVNRWGGRQVTRNRPLRSGKGSLYEGGIRVPLLVRWPGVTPRGATCDRPVVTTDFYPTLCDIAGVGPEARNRGLEGLSLVPLLRDPSARLARDALFFHYPHYYATTTPVSAIRSGTWKLLKYYEDGHVELYNLAEDLGEAHDLSRTMPDRAAALGKRLEQWLEQVGAQRPRPNPRRTRQGRVGQYDVRDFGAVGDGKTLDTPAIQAAIDACAKGGGGRVAFPPGRYLSGTLRLKSHVTLRLASGAVLLGSTRVEDFPIIQPSQPSWSDRYCCRTLIWGEQLEDVAIVGRGTIDGQGAAFRGREPTPRQLEAIEDAWKGPARYRPKPRYANRPYIIRLVGCRRILIEGIRLRNSPMWMQHYLNCDSLTVRGVTVYNHCGANNDMIDIDGCHDVLVADCVGDTDDDALTLKSTSGRATENVTVTNCVLSSHCNAIKMGTESHGGFRNITIANCVVRPSRDREALAGRAEGLAAIALEVVDGGTLDGVAISNITSIDQTVPLFVRLGNRARQYTRDVPRPPVGTLRNIAIDNVVATGAGKIGCSVTGLPGHEVEHLTLSNIRIEFRGGGQAAPPDGEVPEHPDKYPEAVMFGTLPAYGLYVRHVRDLALQNIAFRCAKPDARPAILCDDVDRLTIDHLEADLGPESVAQCVLVATRQALVRGCLPPKGRAFLHIGRACERITAVANDLSAVARPFALAASTPPSVLHAAANRLPAERP